MQENGTFRLIKNNQPWSFIEEARVHTQSMFGPHMHGIARRPKTKENKTKDAKTLGSPRQRLQLL